MEYSSANDPVYVKDKAGNVYTVEYNVKGNPTKIAVPDEGVIERHYNECGQDILVADAKGIKTRKQYNRNYFPQHILNFFR
jgi:YD repeat-containing protein